MARKFPSNTFVAPKYGRGKRLVIAEAPGETESEKGEPLVGQSGQLFDKLCGCAGIKREDLTIVNILNCRPPDNKFPTSPEARSYISHAEGEQAVSHCFKAHVEPLLKGRPWERIDILGDVALNRIAGKDGISTWRGSPVAVPALGDKPLALATYHPSYLLRDQELIQVSINDLEKTLEVPPEKYSLYPTLEQVQNFKATQFSFDIETNYFKVGEDPFIHMVGLCASPYEAIVVPYQGAYIRELRRIFRDAKSIIGHNCIQFDLPVLRYGNIQPSDDCQVWDTMLLQHLRFPNLPHDLEFVASQFSNKPAWKSGKSKAFQLYCARDTDVTLQIFTKLLPLVREEGLLELYKNVQVPLARICYQMFQTGFKVDPSQVGKVRELLLTEMTQLELKLPEQLRSYDKAVSKRQVAPAGTLSAKTGKPIKFLLVPATERVVPWRSSQKKQEYLYGKEEAWQLGLEEQLDLKSGNVTTGKLALDKLFRKTKNAALPALKKLNQLDELVTTFCKEEMTGSAFTQHPHFNVHGTSSGRLSSSDPNLQNIPESARIIYVPSRPGWKIIDVDFSGIESRITAFLAKDKWRLDQLERDPEFSEHKYLAAQMTGVAYDEVEKDNTPGSPYFQAKKVVHGVNYGLGALKLSKMYDLDLKQTKEFIAGWKNIIKDTVFWQQRTVDIAGREGLLTTPFGRKRWFYTSSLYTESLSFIPQSVAADIIFRCMIGLMYDRIGWPEENVKKVVKVYEPLPQPAELLIQVHDSLVLQAPENMVDRICNVLKKVLTQPWPELKGFSIPIGIKVGESWGLASKLSV
jgi:uracil-DNA glycosylase family 4